MINYTINHAAHSPYDLTPDSSHQDVRCCGSPKPPSFVRAMRKPTMAQQKHLMLLKRNGCLDFCGNILAPSSCYSLEFIPWFFSSWWWIISPGKSLKLPPTIIKWYCPVAILTYQMLPLIMTIFYKKKKHILWMAQPFQQSSLSQWTLR